MIPKKILLLLVCFFFTFSCINKLDFDQIEDYSSIPEYTISLTYFNVSTNQIFANSSIQKTSGFEVFDNSFIKNNLIKADFNVEINNEFNNDFVIEVDFLDVNDIITYRYLILAKKLEKTSDVEEVLIKDNLSFLNTTKVSISVSTFNATTIDSNETKNFDFKSFVKIYLNNEV